MVRRTIALALLALPVAVAAQDGKADPRTMAVAGRCRDAKGKPVVRAKVDLYWQDYRGNRQELRGSALTDAAGRFRFEGLLVLGPADWGSTFWFVTAEAKGAAYGGAVVRSTATPAEDLDVVLGEPAPVRGVVRDEHGQPVAGAQVSVLGLGKEWEPESQTARGLPEYAHLFLAEPLGGWSTRADAEGVFSLAALPRGFPARILVQHPRFARQNVDVEAPQDLEVALEAGGTITGRVVRGAPAEPVVAVRVQAQGIRHSAFTSVRTDELGRFRLESLPTDDYNVWAIDEGWTVIAHGGVVVGGGQLVPVPDLALVRGGFIEGVVIDDASGKGVEPGPTADVGLYGPSRPRAGAAVECADIGADGRFKIRVAPGSNYVYLRSGAGWGPGPGAESYTVDVGEGETATVEFRVARTRR